MQSAAGYYIGRACNDPEIGVKEVSMPYSRESGYFASKKIAEDYLKYNLVNSQDI